MGTKNIDHVLGVVREAWLRNPEMRLAQLLVNAAKASDFEDISRSKLFYMEDEQLLQGIENLEVLRQRREEAAGQKKKG
jgi:uncharacterized protein YihD (DUF1040 family)